MPPIRKTAALSALIGGLLLAGMSGEASAARKQVDSTVNLDALSADGVAGKVSSSQAACRAKRTVTVYMVNTSSPSTTVPFGAAITSGDGSWSIQDWAYPGEYFAVVADRTTRHFVCETATSNPKTWWTSGAAP
jgi:hypothetical protein